jgi:hypothetical protein
VKLAESICIPKPVQRFLDPGMIGVKISMNGMKKETEG